MQTLWSCVCRGHFTPALRVPFIAYYHLHSVVRDVHVCMLGAPTLQDSRPDAAWKRKTHSRRTSLCTRSRSPTHDHAKLKCMQTCVVAYVLYHAVLNSSNPRAPPAVRAQ